MNPVELLAWIGAVCASIIIVTLTIVIVAAAWKSIREPRRAKSTSRKVL